MFNFVDMGDSKYRQKSSKCHIREINVQLYKHVNCLCESKVFIYIRHVTPWPEYSDELYIHPLYTDQLPVIVLVATRKRFEI